MKIRKTTGYILAGFMVLLLLTAPPARAQDCPDPDVPVNRSTELAPEFFDNQVLEGCDPYCPDGEMDYCQQGGTRRGSPGSSGASVVSDVSRPRFDCPPTKKLDDTCEQEYPDCTGRPGGRTGGGADSVCEKGAGLPTYGLAGILAGIFPGFPTGFMDCIAKLLGGLSFDGVGGFIGSFINNVTISGGADVGRDGLCLGGSVGVCGFSLAGEICVLDELGNAVAAFEEGINFIEVYAPGIIEVGTAIDDFQGPVIMVDGGFLEGFGEIEPGSIVHVFINEEGESALYVFPPGTAVADIVSGAAEGVGTMVAKFEEGEEFVRKLTMYGLTRVPSENVVLGAEDDEPRISDDVADDYINDNDDNEYDLDGDGVVDGYGIDEDGDGITDGVDTNGDGLIDVYGIDINGDGIADGIPVDSDGDGIIDGLDTDGGGVDIRSIDINGDGVNDGYGVDANGDGIIDGIDSNGDGGIDTIGIDTNGDGIMDGVALDRDGDGVIDGIDRNGDGTPDVIGVDNDGDGVKDGVAVDRNGDGIVDGLDSDGNGIADIQSVDVTGDGVRDGIQIDSNNDGKVDGIDSDGNGIINYRYIDVNSDGTYDGVDMDGDGVPDHDL